MRSMSSHSASARPDIRAAARRMRSGSALTASSGTDPATAGRRPFRKNQSNASNPPERWNDVGRLLHRTDERGRVCRLAPAACPWSTTTIDFENGTRFPTLERLPRLRRACTRVLAIQNATSSSPYVSIEHAEARNTWQCSDALLGAQPLTGNSRSGHVHFAVGPRCDEPGPMGSPEPEGTSPRVLHGNRCEKGAQVTP